MATKMMRKTTTKPARISFDTVDMGLSSIRIQYMCELLFLPDSGNIVSRKEVLTTDLFQIEIRLSGVVSQFNALTKQFHDRGTDVATAKDLEVLADATANMVDEIQDLLIKYLKSME